MISDDSFDIKRYDFNSGLFIEFQSVHYAKDLWPLVYILSDGKTKDAYIGETTDAFARMSSHLKSNAKNKLTAIHLITSEKFNKSATLDVESNLIKYMFADGHFNLINGNVGIANHNYYQKNEIYWDLFKSIWDKLRAQGISKHALDYIDNSALFKYSPYKSLTDEQKKGLLIIITGLLKGEFKNIIIEGAAGTGKTILAIFLFKLIHSEAEDFNYQEFGEDEEEFIQLVAELKKKFGKPKMALVVPMSSFRNTLKKIFKNVKGLNANMVIGPAEIVKEKFDIVVVDESHRLRRRINLGTYFHSFDIASNKLGFDKNKSNELDWILRQSKNTILFYDESQSIKPSDVKKEEFDKLKSGKFTKTEYLKHQFRVKGGNNYVRHIKGMLDCSFDAAPKAFIAKEYEFLLFESLSDMIKEIKQRDKQNGLSRLIAGYSWKWISKKDKKKFDIKIGDVELRWNSVSNDWINSENAINEVGCIHTTQGYDLNYAGIIFGNEITYDKVKDEIVILKENYFDKNGKQTINDPAELKAFVLNIYKTIMLRAIKGTYIYVCDEKLREYLAQYIVKYKAEKPVIFLPASKIIPFENSVPVFDLKVAAGNFGEVQNVSDFKWVEVPARYKSQKDLFACKVVGESMNKIIPNGSICLFRRYTAGSRDGKIVLVEHTDLQESEFGSSYTIKEYRSKKKRKHEEWRHQSITLKPLSYNPEFKDIELSERESENLKVIGVFEQVLS